MDKLAAILQSNYIPWKGYFDLINQVDEFILYDDMQYTRRDWRNRNKIKTSNGVIWLTIPVETKGKYYEKIKEIKVSDPNWAKTHWKTIEVSYARAKYFKEYRERFETLYLESQEQYLSEINYRFITEICKLLNITTRLSWSSSYQLAEGRTERLVGLCKQVGATRYLSGPAAKDYMEEELFQNEGLTVEYADYSGYPEYTQLYPPFDHAVSILDLIFNEGPNASRYMKSF